jgi:MFS transporter, DHA3 family, macrolide efflux protein
MLLRNPAIARVTAARFIARLGGEAAFFIGVWGMAAYTFQATPGQIAALMAVLAVSSMVGASIAGTLVDRFGPTRVLVGAQFFYVPVVIAVTFVSSMDALVAMSALLGLSTAPIMTATGSFGPYLADEPERIESVNALLEGAGALSFVLGPAMGAVVAKAFSIDAVFYVDAVLTTVGALLVIGVKTPPPPGKARSGALREVVEGVRVSYGMRAVRYYILMGTLMWFSFGAFGALEPLFYRDVVKTGVETIGYVNSLFGLGIAFGAWVLTRIPSRFTNARALAAGVALMGLCSALYVGTSDLRVIAAGALVWGMVIGAVEPMLRTLMQLDTPEEYLGRVMGTAQVHRSAGEIVPLALAPGLAAAFGVQPVMIGGAIVATVVALSTFGYAASIDRDGHASRGPVRLDEAFAHDDPLSPLS